MNKEDFVSLECAKLLKEKGYNNGCKSYYYNGEFKYGRVPLSNDCRDDAVSAPSIHVAHRWLIKNENMYVAVIGFRLDQWAFNLCQIDTEDGFFINIDGYVDGFSTYESALNAGIIEALKTIKK